MIDISRASKQEKDDALKESLVLSSLKHPYIVRYRENFLEDGWLCIVMDFCEGGDLSDRLKKSKQANKNISEEQLLRWFTQGVLALKYIHDKHILHRDLKAGNFFLSKANNMKMGDFGIAKVLECTAAQAQTQIGTPYYLSPEICQGKPYSWASDIWSMGIILFEMCAKRVPFEAPDLRTLIQRITKGPTPEPPREYSPEFRQLVRDLLNRDPAQRPPAGDILKKPIIQGVVKKMLAEVQVEEQAAASGGSADRSGSDGRPLRERGASAAAAPAGPAAAPSSAAPPVAQRRPVSYSKGDAVEYWSETHKEWLPATVTGVDDRGRMMLNVKPNVWLSTDVQKDKVRPRPVVGQKAPTSGGSRGGSRGSAGSAGQSRQSSQPRLPPAPAPVRSSEQRRPGSRGAVGSGGGPPGGDALRQPSPMRGGRQASPMHPQPPGRQASPLHQQAGRQPSPMRGASPRHRGGDGRDQWLHNPPAAGGGSRQNSPFHGAAGAAGRPSRGGTPGGFR